MKLLPLLLPLLVLSSGCISPEGYSTVHFCGTVRQGIAPVSGSARFRIAFTYLTGYLDGVGQPEYETVSSDQTIPVQLDEQGRACVDIEVDELMLYEDDWYDARHNPQVVNLQVIVGDDTIADGQVTSSSASEKTGIVSVEGSFDLDQPIVDEPGRFTG